MSVLKLSVLQLISFERVLFLLSVPNNMWMYNLHKHERLQLKARNYAHNRIKKRNIVYKQDTENVLRRITSLCLSKPSSLPTYKNNKTLMMRHNLLTHYNFV
jgi:hypothetical protein